MNLPTCPNCSRYVDQGTKHLHLPGGWCEVIYQPKLVQSTVANPKKQARPSEKARRHSN